MKHSLNELHHERGRLEERIALQRRALSADLVPVANAFNVGERVNQSVNRALTEGKLIVRDYPLVTLAVVGVLIVARPRTFIRLAQRGVGLWRTWRSVRSMLPDSLLRQML